MYLFAAVLLMRSPFTTVPTIWPRKSAHIADNCEIWSFSLPKINSTSLLLLLAEKHQLKTEDLSLSMNFQRATSN